jgi:hypothetical protein
VYQLFPLPQGDLLEPTSLPVNVVMNPGHNCEHEPIVSNSGR